MLMTGANVSDKLKPIRLKRESGSMRMKQSKRRASANILWKRVTASYDEDVRTFAKNPALVAPVTRWVLFGHLTPMQGMAGRRYADIIRKFARFSMEGQSMTPRSANLEPVKAEDQELERHFWNGTLGDYEADARHAKRQYRRLMKVLDRYADHVTRRNFAKDYLDMLCCQDQEPPAQHRADVANVLTAIAKEFGLGEKKRRIQ